MWFYLDLWTAAPRCRRCRFPFPGNETAAGRERGCPRCAEAFVYQLEAAGAGPGWACRFDSRGSLVVDPGRADSEERRRVWRGVGLTGFPPRHAWRLTQESFCRLLAVPVCPRCGSDGTVEDDAPDQLPAAVSPADCERCEELISNVLRGAEAVDRWTVSAEPSGGAQLKIGEWRPGCTDEDRAEAWRLLGIPGPVPAGNVWPIDSETALRIIEQRLPRPRRSR